MRVKRGDQRVVDTKYRVHYTKTIEDQTVLENVSKNLTDLANEAWQVGGL